MGKQDKLEKLIPQLKLQLTYKSESSSEETSI
jgi:hypothetical protein